MRKVLIASLAILVLAIIGCKTKQDQSGTVDSLSVPVSENLPAVDDRLPADYCHNPGRSGGLV